MTCNCSLIKSNESYYTSAVAYDNSAIESEQAQLAADQASLAYWQNQDSICGCSGSGGGPHASNQTNAEEYLNDLREKAAEARSKKESLKAVVIEKAENHKKQFGSYPDGYSLLIKS